MASTSSRRSEILQRKAKREDEKSMRARGVDAGMLERIQRMVGGVPALLAARSGDPRARKARTYFSEFAPLTPAQLKREKVRADFLRSVEGNPRIQDYEKRANTDRGYRGVMQANGVDPDAPEAVERGDRGMSGNYAAVARAARQRNRLNELAKRGFAVKRSDDGSVMSTHVSIGDRNYGTVEDALAAAKRIGDNNQRRGRLISMLTKMGVSRSDLSELYGTHEGLQGLAINDNERNQIGAALTKYAKGLFDSRSNVVARYNQQMGLLKGQINDRAGLVAELLKSRDALKGKSSGFGGAIEGSGYGDMLAAASGAAATVGAGVGLRGRRTSTGGSAALAFNATDRSIGNGISSSGSLRARFTGTGSGSLSAIGGGSGSSANNPAVAFRSMLKTAIGEDPGGRVVGYTPSGEPIFTADRRGGYDHTSFEQSQYNRDAADYRKDVDRLVSDSFAPGGNGLGIRMMRNARTARALEMYYDKFDRQFSNALKNIATVASMAGIQSGQFGFQHAPEMDKPPSVQRLQPGVPSQGHVDVGQNEGLNEVDVKRRAAHPEEYE